VLQLYDTAESVHLSRFYVVPRIRLHSLVVRVRRLRTKVIVASTCVMMFAVTTAARVSRPVLTPAPVSVHLVSPDHAAAQVSSHVH